MIFYLNAERVELTDPDPRSLLSDYLRSREIGLTGTKVACGEGGCGSCTVILSRWDAQLQTTTHHPINACLRSLCALDGTRITTIEGVRGPDGKPHPVETSLAAHNGSQCGMCTPGFIMNMISLVATEPSPSEERVENRFDGNLCRCTGYRSILASMREVRDVPAYLPDLPAELVERARKPTSLFFEKHGFLWLRPVSLAELVELRTRYPHARLVSANTGIGFYPESRPVTIEIAPAIPELQGCFVDADGVNAGAGTTLLAFHGYLSRLAPTLPDWQAAGIRALLAQLLRMGNVQIRGVATLGGNIGLVCAYAHTRQPLISDLETALVGLGAWATVISGDGSERRLPIEEITADSGLISRIHIPFSTQGDIVQSYKVAARPQNSHALVSALFRARVNADNVVEEAALAFGGIAPRAIRSPLTEDFLRGQPWTEVTLRTALVSLAADIGNRILNWEDIAFLPDGYRQSAAESVFYRYFLSVSSLLDPASIQPRFLSGAETFRRPLSSGTQNIPAGAPANPPVGEPVQNLNAPLLTSGEAKFTQDIPLPLHGFHGAPVLSRCALAAFTWRGGLAAVLAELQSRIPGTRALVTIADVSGKNLQGIGGDEPVFADGEVLYHGHLIAIVLHANAHQAAAAAELAATFLDYAPFADKPPVLSIDAALALPDRAGLFPDAGLNLHVPNIIRKGSDLAWLANPSAPLPGATTVSGRQHVTAQAHFYLETQTCLAIPDENRSMVLYASTQNPASDQSTASSMLNLPAVNVQVCVRRLGGGFGGKQSRASLLSGATAVAANACGRPVRVCLNRHQDMAWSGKRHPFQGRYHIALNSHGQILAMKTAFLSNGGCSYDLSFAIMDLAQQHADNCYFIPTFETTGDVARTNLPSNTAFRTFGVVQSLLIQEEAIEHAAHHIGITAETLRRRNMYQRGSLESFQRTHYDQALTYCAAQEIWDHAAADCNFASRQEEVAAFNRANRWRKRGICMIPVKYGIGFQPRLLDQAGALVNIYAPDGSVLIQHGGVEMGQGLATKMVQVAAEALGIPIEWIRQGDVLTTAVPNTSPTSGSTGSDLNGGALLLACQTLRKRLEQYCVDHQIKGWQANWQSMWKEIVGGAYVNRVDLSAEAHYRIPGLQEIGFTHQFGRAFHYFIYSVCCSEVEIDVLTGETLIRRADLYYDAGDSLNPLLDIGQLEGGFVQGTGLMLSEQMMIDSDGRVVSNGTWDYKPPCSLSIPADFRVNLFRGDRFDPVSGKPLDHQALHHSRGIGEPGLVPSVSVFFAVKRAILAARQDTGDDNWFEMDAPATVARVKHFCGTRREDLRFSQQPDGDR
jgi:xanthine dehydrogenase/oxidase